MEIRSSAKFLIIFSIIAGVVRILPHPPNATPILALALFAGAGAGTRKPWVFFIPLAVLLATDIYIGVYNIGIMASVYGSFLVVSVLGKFIKRISPGKVFMASMSGSIFFYIVTNAAVWALGSWYPKTVAGLLSSYALALPFFRNMLVADIVYSAAFFGIYALATNPSFIYKIKQMFVAQHLTNIFVYHKQ